MSPDIDDLFKYQGKFSIVLYAIFALRYSNIWKLGLSIATSDKNDKYLYDVSRIEKAGQAGKLSHIPARDNLATYKDEVNRLREKNKNPGPFALRAPVEETRDLIAVHNATEKMSVD